MTTARHSRASCRKTLTGIGTGLLLIFSLGVASAAELYRWTDSRGVVHFTDKPPKGVNAERVTTKRSNSLSNPARDAEEAETAQAADPNAERCRIERERLAILQSNSRIQMEGRDGNLKELSEEEVRQEISLTQRAIERFCKPAAPAAE
jgi:hypothetical protein